MMALFSLFETVSITRAYTAFQITYNFNVNGQDECLDSKTFDGLRSAATINSQCRLSPS
jgi:hypothetical protein